MQLKTPPTSNLTPNGYVMEEMNPPAPLSVPSAPRGPPAARRDVVGPRGRLDSWSDVIDVDVRAKIDLTDSAATATERIIHALLRRPSNDSAAAGGNNVLSSAQSVLSRLSSHPSRSIASQSATRHGTPWIVVITDQLITRPITTQHGSVIRNSSILSAQNSVDGVRV